MVDSEVIVENLRALPQRLSPSHFVPAVMIVDGMKAQNPEPSPDDLPPAYFSVAGPSTLRETAPSSSGSGSDYPNDKPQRSDEPSRASAISPVQRSTSGTTPQVAPAGWIANMLGTPQAKKDKEVRSTVLGLLQGMIQHGDSSESLPIFESCMNACRNRGLFFADIAQEPSIQGHTPLYWTIIKSVYSNDGSESSAQYPWPSGPSATSSPGDGLRTLFGILLSFPLKQSTYDDALQACLLTSSHATFLVLRSHNPVPPLSIPGYDIFTEDDVEVTSGNDAQAALNGAFKVSANIKHFQKRMRLLKEIPIEFIARGRMWALTFHIYDPYKSGRFGYIDAKSGSWLLMLDLIASSPPTFLDSRVSLGIHALDVESEAPTEAASPFRARSSNRAKPVEPMVCRMQSKTYEQMSGACRGEINVNLSEQTHGLSLEFDGCPYIRSDGSLQLTLEATLVKPGQHPECTVM